MKAVVLLNANIYEYTEDEWLTSVDDIFIGVIELEGKTDRVIRKEMRSIAEDYLNEHSDRIYSYIHPNQYTLHYKLI